MKLSANKTYILPTKFGLALGFVAFLVFIIAITFGHPFSYFITFFIVAIIIVCAFYTNNSISRLKSFSFKDEYVELGVDSSILFEISSKEVGEYKNIETKVGKRGATKVSSVGEKNLKLRAMVNPSRCGVFSLWRVRISSTYPLGLFYAWKYIMPNKEAIVYPKRVRDKSSSYESEYVASEEESLDLNPESNDEFLDHRRFRDNDYWKHIDWKAYARGRGLLTKNFSGTSSKVKTIKMSSSDNLEKLGIVVNDVLDAFESNRDSILICDNEVVSRGRNLGHLNKCLRVLSQFGGRVE